MIDNRLRRLGSIALAAGTILFGAASLFHPPTVNPWDPRVSLAEAIHAEWVIDHWALLVAVALVHLGLFARHSHMRTTCGGRYHPIAFALGIASLSLWLAIFLFEATGWPILAKAISAHGGVSATIGVAQAPGPGSGLGSVPGLGPVPGRGPVPGPSPSPCLESGPGGGDLPVSAPVGETLDVVARAIWATSLSLGYAAAFLFGLATMLWSMDLVTQERLPRWFSRLGIVAGCFTAIVQPLSLSTPSNALWFLIPAAVLLGAWLLLAAWYLWCSDPPGCLGEGRSG